MPYRRFLVQFLQNSSYKKAFFQRNILELPAAGCEIDGRLTALQLKESFDLLLEFDLYLVFLKIETLGTPSGFCIQLTCNC